MDKHLSWLKQHYELTTWPDSKILPGEEWEQVIDVNLNDANLILLLISSNFLASEYRKKEMQRALELNRTGACRVITIILRPCHWQDAPFSNLPLLPTNARPVTGWRNRDGAFQNIASQINLIIRELLISLKKTKEEWNKEGNALYSFKRYEEALAAHEQAVHLDPNNAVVYRSKVNNLSKIKRHEEANQAYEKARQLSKR